MEHSALEIAPLPAYQGEKRMTPSPTASLGGAAEQLGRYVDRLLHQSPGDRLRRVDADPVAHGPPGPGLPALRTLPPPAGSR